MRTPRDSIHDFEGTDQDDDQVGIEVRRLTGDEVSVRDVEEGRQSIGGEVVDLSRRREQGAVRDDSNQQGEQRGEEPPQASTPEDPQANRSRFDLFQAQQSRDQVAAQNEEDVDAEQPAGARVVEDHRQHGDGAKTV